MVAWAGVLANFFLSFLLFSLIFLVSGIPTKTDRVIIEGITNDSPAQKAGISPGDIVISLNNEAVKSVDDFVEKMEKEKGKQVALILERNDKQLILEVTAREKVPEGEGPLGVVVSPYRMVRYPFWQMPVRAGVEGIKETYAWTVMIAGELLKMFRNLILAGQVPKDIAGPIGIFQVTSSVAASGIVAVFQFIAILSINLAIINVLPFPALDGGRSFFILIEAILGRRSPAQAEKWINSLGMAFLLFLMLLVTVNDIKRIMETTQFGLKLRSIWPF